MKKLFSLQIDVSMRALKAELEEIENKCLNASNDVPTAEIQNQISMLEGRINSTNEDLDIQSGNMNQLMVRFFFYSLPIANLTSYIHFCRLIFKQCHLQQNWSL